jgi:hypothetical protein
MKHAAQIIRGRVWLTGIVHPMSVWLLWEIFVQTDRIVARIFAEMESLSLTREKNVILGIGNLSMGVIAVANGKIVRRRAKVCARMRQPVPKNSSVMFAARVGKCVARSHCCAVIAL